MKKAAKSRPKPDIQDEYDFSKDVRGKYYKRYQEDNNVVVIAADLAKILPDSKSANEAL